VRGLADAPTYQGQGRHYDSLADLYEAHATDESTVRYRRRFIDEPLFRDIELSGAHVLEAMCGSGHSTGFLLERGARVTGLDVSEQAMALFAKKWPSCRSVVGNILDDVLSPGEFDVVLVVGGLHHVQPHVDAAVERIWTLLKPGGFFCFAEPHTGSVFDLLRRAWYRHDPFFQPNEAAIDLCGIRHAAEGKFVFGDDRYFGNIGHTLVLNSMVLRVPPRLKRLYAKPAMTLEAALNPLLGRRLSCSVSCRWQKA
jgi:SAM-dependent methyltransferase